MHDLPDVPFGQRTLDATINRKPRPGQVERIIGAKADAGGIGEAVGLCRDHRADSAKAFELALVQRVSGFVSAGKVAHQRVDQQPVEDARSGFLQRQAQPVDAGIDHDIAQAPARLRSEEHTSELQSLMRNPYAVFCLTKKKLSYL